MRMKAVSLTLAAFGMALGLGAAQPARAEDYPNRVITLVVGMAPGSVTDTAARIVAQRAAQILGENVIVINKPGAASMIASESVVRAPADGYTLLLTSVAMSVNPSLYKRVPYDAATDLVPVAFLVNAPQILVVNPSVGVKTLGEFLEKYKDAKNLNYASPGVGTMPHLAAEVFSIKSGIKMNHVPYRGGAPALNDVIAGNVQLTFITPVAKGHIQSGEVRALAVASKERLETLPDIPTFAQVGLPLPEINAGAWFGVMAPKGTPPAIVAKLNGAFDNALRDEAVREKLKNLGLIPDPMTPAEFGGFVHQDKATWETILGSAGIAKQ